MKLDINDLKRGSIIVFEGSPSIVLSAKHIHMGRGGAVVQSKIKDLQTGKIAERSFKSSDSFEEAEIDKTNVVFIYERNGEYWFHEKGKPGSRFPLGAEEIGEQSIYLKPNMEVLAFMFNGQVINIELPIKAEYEVIDAPPSIRGNTSSGGSKQVTIEGGAKVNVPLFIEAGDRIRVNTDTGEYAERAN